MKRRRSDAAGLEDVERSLHTSFCAAANAISHLYTQAQHQHKIVFHAGQRHALEKLLDWIHNQHGITPSTVDIINYLKIEIENVNRTETAITQTQNPPLVASQQQMAPPNLFGRVDDQRPPVAYQHGFLSG